MPQSETYWNPYRWVRVNNTGVERAAPLYQHRLDGLAGRLYCRLVALTPLWISDGRGSFIHHAARGKPQPFIPGTSLKGAIRSLAELVGNTTVPFPEDKVDVDPAHGYRHAISGAGASWQLDMTARMFGHLGHGRNARNFAGLVRFSDAEFVADSAPAMGNTWEASKVVCGNPKPAHHAFYPRKDVRKFYHHHVGARSLVGPAAGIKPDQIRTVRPAPPGAAFTFTVDFFNLRQDEVSLLLYCLVLEESVTVTLSKEALGIDHHEPSTLTGPMRHKIGGCKPQGAGSVHLRLERMELHDDPTSRYRSGGSTAQNLDGSALQAKVADLIQPIAGRQDVTMQELRAMLIYAENDPRARMEYPDYSWFQAEKKSSTKTPLKPTL